MLSASVCFVWYIKEGVHKWITIGITKDEQFIFTGALFAGKKSSWHELIANVFALFNNAVHSIVVYAQKTGRQFRKSFMEI